MKTWRVARRDLRCGSCSTKIAACEKYLELQYGARTSPRCARCAKGTFNEDAPDVVVDDEPQRAVPAGIRHQASLGFEPAPATPAFVSSRSLGDQARRRLANHLRNRGRA